MAPRLRSGYKPELQAILKAGGSVNTQGLPALAVELLLEIASYAVGAPIPCSDHKPLPIACLQRTTTLRILSQLCRSLRNALLPALWERIEACATANPKLVSRWSGLRTGHGPHWWKDLATDLVAQLETVTIREPSLASYVRTVNVLITPYSADTVLVELARCLALMPNLQTVQLMSYRDRVRIPGRRRDVYMPELYKAAFAGYRFPSVRRVVLPINAKCLFSCFPEVRRVYMNEKAVGYLNPSHDEVDYLKEVAKHCSKVEEFQWSDDFFFSPLRDRQNVYHMLPSLRRVRLQVCQDSVEMIKTLTGLKHLDTIVLVARRLDDPRVVEQLAEAARKVLATSPSNEEKTLIIQQPYGTEVIRSFGN